MSDEKLVWLWGAMLIAFAVIAVITFTIAWKECRAADFSVLYCIIQLG